MKMGRYRVLPIVGFSLFLGGCPGQLPGIVAPQYAADGFFGGTHLRNYHQNLEIGGIYVTSQGALGPGSDILQICDRDSRIVDKTIKTDGLSDASGSWNASFGGNLTALKIAVVKFGIDVSAVGSATYAFSGVEQINVIDSRTRTRNGSIKDLIGQNCQAYIDQYRTAGRDVFVISGAFKVKSAELTYTKKAETSIEGGAVGTGLPGGKINPKGDETRKTAGANVYVEIVADKF
jgi:hypothetical protein